MNFDEIMAFNLPYNEDNLNELIKKIQSNDIVPYIGAGMSVLFDEVYPTWNEFLKKTGDKYIKDREREYYDSLDYEDKAGFLYKEMGPITFPNHIKETFGARHLNKDATCFIDKSVYLLPIIFNKGLLITTNYDKVIEKIYTLYEKVITVAHSGDYEALNRSLRDNELLLYKIHGDITNPNTSLIISKDQYEEAYSKPELKDALKQAFISKEMFFLGSSMAKDRPVELMCEISKPGMRNFAILPCNEENLKNRRIELENKYFTQAIFYPSGKHECLNVILEYIAKKVNLQGIDKAIKNFSNRKVQNNDIRINPNNLQEMISQKDQDLLNGLVLPWLSDKSPRLNSIFKSLFIKPIVKSSNNRKEISYNELLDYLSKSGMIALTGDAGCGKSTLIKYLYLFEVRGKKRFYFSASEILEGKAPIFYELIALSENTNMVLCVDGLDEAYLIYKTNIERLMNELKKFSKKCCILVGMRKDFFNMYFSNPYYGFFSDVLTIESWNEQMADSYTLKYSQEIKNKTLYKQYNQLADSNINIKSFTKNPFHLTLLLYLIETKNENISTYYSVYSLYDDFYEHWRLREQHRKTSNANRGRDTFKKHYKIACSLYSGKSIYLKEEENDTAVTGLLIIKESSEGKNIIRFYHHSLNEYIIAKKCLEQFESKGIKLVSVLLNLMRNDVTDFIKDAFKTLDTSELAKIKRNLEDIYRLIYAPDKSSISNKIQKLNYKELFTLKDQIVFFISRIPEIPAKDFLRYANKKENDPIMKLNLAYGAALKGPILEIALEYAKKITTGSSEDITNRSWTLVYYGDVKEDAYTYVDEWHAPWFNSRNARIRRLQENHEKAIRFRMFDLPLLYTFLVSRNWNDICEDELLVIEKCNTDYPELPTEVNKFMTETKEKLYLEYKEQLKKICNNEM